MLTGTTCVKTEVSMKLTEAQAVLGIDLVNCLLAAPRRRVDGILENISPGERCEAYRAVQRVHGQVYNLPEVSND